MAARLLAVLAAVAMIVGAVVVRDRRDGDGGASASGKPRLVCATEFEAVCDGLAADGKASVTVEPAADTADALAKLGPDDQPPYDGWLVTAPWPAMVNAQAVAPVVTPGPVVARSPVVLAVRSDRKALLQTACGGPVGWKCLGAQAGRPWQQLGGDSGSVTPAHAAVSGVAGLTVLGAATAGYFGTTDLSRENLDDAGFRSWLSGLERAAPDDDEPADTLASRPSAYDAVGALEAQVGSLVASTRQPKADVLYPDPVATADVVLATTSGRGGPALSALLASPAARSLLAHQGWRIDDQSRPSWAQQGTVLPKSSNLPDAGVLAALRQRAGVANR